ncbi:Hypothetical_protein [Hexamita inflata]|uniref:Hypothetical_protein n=1 Tax=Hexamita inflata TaxID=28002 RepID=A0AA86PJB8_9EUKA|nr:Hypothetical protein HINF_LOCUS27816 [Hexamita inflata]
MMITLSGCNLHYFEPELFSTFQQLQEEQQIQLFKFNFIEYIQTSPHVFFEHYIFIQCSIQIQLDLKRTFSYFISQVQFEVTEMIDFNYVTQLHKQAQKRALTKHEELNTAGTNQRRPSEVFKLKFEVRSLQHQKQV